MSGGSYLDVIVPDVRRRLAQRRTARPLAALQDAAAVCVLTRPAGHGAAPGQADATAQPSFSAALSGSGLSLIAEVKRRSPSKGLIRPGLDVADLVAEYEKGGAAAVSVLTEGDHFHGSLADLQVAAAAGRLPLLRKDFIIDPYQIYEARVHGASAVLLIAALLDDLALGGLAALAQRLGLDVLLEVHDAGELRRALAVEGAVIGINNRDLRSFEVSLDTSLRLAGLVPPDRILVAESGIRHREDAERLASCGVDAVLVGESLLRQEETAPAVSALVRPPCAVARRSGHTSGAEEVR